MSGSATPQLSVTGFEGPLDFLIEMVRRQQVDLGRLSILTLTDQLVAAIEAEGTTLARRADWLVLASELLLLKARLLLPASPAEAEDAEASATRRLDLLQELARMRAGAAWLAARPQLGQVVFARGQSRLPAARSQAELYVAFLEATLAMLEGPLQRPIMLSPAYRPRPPDLWRIPDALRHIAALLAQHPTPLTLVQCLPSIPRQAPDRPIRVRAALASSFAAGLEMARDGTAGLEQQNPFGAVFIQGISSSAEPP